MAIIEVQNLKYRYPLAEELVLNDVSFTVEKGDILGIIGRNNAGKSTLSAALAGIIPHFYKGAYGGKVFIDRMEVKTSTIADISQKVGIIFQNPFNQITGAKRTVYEEVAFGLENFGVPPEKMHEEIDAALKLLEIWELRDKNPFSLSGGQMQRLAIASIIAMKPEIIIFDEPTSQLDPQGTKEVFEAIKMLASQGITILIIEQKMELLVEVCPRLMLLSKGEIVDIAKPSTIFSRTDIDTYGIDLPVYTEVARNLKLKNTAGEYPVTLQETVTLLKGAK